MGLAEVARRGAATAVKGVAAAVDRVSPPGPGVVVLIYHRVGQRTASSVDLATDVFDAQVGELGAAGRIIALDDALNGLAGGDREVDSPVVLTFDDGTADWVDIVLPVLDRHRAPATFFVATEFVDRQLPFWDDGRPATWAGLAELVASGLATIGSHTHSHALLDRVDGPTAEAELDRSIDLLGEHLGVTVEHFAYPKALLGSPAAETAVQGRFRSAAVAGSRVNPWAGTDPYRLARTPIQVADGMRWFRHKAAGGLHLEDDARSLLNRRRYAGATS